MTKVEMIFVIAACCVPIVALLTILPKRKKKEKRAKKVDAVAEPFVMDKVEESIEEKKEVVAKTDDFSDYVLDRPKDLKRRNKMPDWLTNGADFTLPKREINKESGTIAEQFNDLTPELKAMFIAGVFDRKDY